MKRFRLGRLIRPPSQSGSRSRLAVPLGRRPVDNPLSNALGKSGIRPERYGGKGCSLVAAMVPERALVLVTPDDFADTAEGRPARRGTWAILLDPIDAATTRLVVRSRSGRRENLGRFLIFDPAHFVMERGMMLGIRDRAEAEQRARSGRAKLAA